MATSGTTIEPTLRGRVLAGLGAAAACAAWLGSDPNARLAAAMLLAPLLIDWLAKPRRLHRIEVHVGLRRTTAGAPFTESLTLVASSGTPLRECMLVEPRTMRNEPPALVAKLEPGRAHRVQLRARSQQRSHVLERVFLLVTSWPLGLFRARAVLAVAAELITEPARVRLAADLTPAMASVQAPPRDRMTLPGPEFHSLREHQLGEDARGVHALRSATLGTLVRRVTQGRMPQTVGLVIDLRRPAGRPIANGSRRFEWSLGAAASLLTMLRARGTTIDILVLDAEPTRIRVQSPAAERELLTLLAEASPARHVPLAPELFDPLQKLERCYWIAAGAHLAPREYDALAGKVTMIAGDFE